MLSEYVILVIIVWVQDRKNQEKKKQAEEALKLLPPEGQHEFDSHGKETKKIGNLKLAKKFQSVARKIKL